MSLRYQINLRIVLASLAILILGGVVAMWQARNAVGKEIVSSLNLAAQLIQLNFPEARHSAVDADAWLPRFVSLEQTRHLRIQLQKANGETVKFTADPKPTETEDAPPHWFSRWAAGDYPPVRQTLLLANGDYSTLLIEADPSDEIGEAWKESRSFFVSLLILTLLTFAAINLVFNKTFKTITVIIEGLKAVEQGEYRQKLPLFDTEEYDRIAQAINHLTEVLDTAHRENNALALHSLQIQEEERQHLARELHDELGQSLTAIKVMTVTLQKIQADSALTPIADDICRICDHLLTVVRSMMRQLHPLMLDELGLKATLEDLLNHWASRHPELALTLDCPDTVDALPHAMTIQVYRIVQECITNVVRHAGASAATIRLQIDGAWLNVRVEDNGGGCEPKTLVSGFGVSGMRARINSLNGHFSIQTRPQQGLSMTAAIPLP